MKKKDKKSTKAIMTTVMFLIFTFILTGCGEKSASPEEGSETSSEKVEMENITEPEVYLSDNGLIFKTDVNRLSEQVVPDYEIHKVDRIYAGNEEIGGRVYESRNGTNISYGELGSEAVGFDEKQAVERARDWIGKAFQGFDISLLDNREPVVMDIRQTMLSEGQEETVIGYSIQYYNQYEGMKILYEGISVMLDDSGVISGNIEWNDYEKAEPPEGTETIQKVDFKQSQVLVAEAVKKENKEFGLNVDSEDAITVSSVELVFAQEVENGAYRPVWYYELEDGRVFYVGCLDGKASHM